MSRTITADEWARYGEEMQASADSFLTKTITWVKVRQQINTYMEDAGLGNIQRQIRVLCNYNNMRTWPITQFTETGQLDHQSVQLFFYAKDFTTAELTQAGIPDIRIETDLFIIDGIQYTIAGDTAVAQGYLGKDYFFTYIAKRDITQVGKRK